MSACVPTHQPADGGAGSPASKRDFQGQLELPAGSGCDITDRRKTLGPGFPNETPESAGARQFSLPLLLLRSPIVPKESLAWTLYILNFFPFFPNKSRKCSGGI